MPFDDMHAIHMKSIVGRSLELSLADQAQALYLFWRVATLLGLEVLPKRFSGLQVYWMVRHDWIVLAHCDRPSYLVRPL